MSDKDYVCPQCGPDPAGPEAHQQSHHMIPSFDDSEELAALRARVATLEAEKASLVADCNAWTARVAELEADAARWAFYREHRASLVPNSRTRLDEWLIPESLRAGGVDACIDEMMRLAGNKSEVRNG